MTDAYRRVDQWSKHTQETGGSLCTADPDLPVGVATVWYPDRSLDAMTIPAEPIPTGVKVWTIARFGYYLRWLW
ncbi:AC transposable element-derived protein 4 [Colletotrichum tofieldiae]|nr:AC transposable element-derived protein 4 [Colletotrichum tofieldiae]GKT77672.1 AC transposable element-derived protein 4 [Colletotrichum tofieldiae]